MSIFKFLIFDEHLYTFKGLAMRSVRSTGSPRKCTATTPFIIYLSWADESKKKTQMSKLQKYIIFDFREHSSCEVAV